MRVLAVMRRISHEQRVLIIHCLVEGMSMRGTSRVARVSINTIASVLREIGVLADQYHHDNVVGVRAKRVQLDEIWGFIAAKAKTAKAKGRKDAGDIWTWVALDPDTKLVISYLCGSRSGQAAFGFMLDLKGRLVGPIPHFTSDGLLSYEDAIYRVFGPTAPYTRLVFDEKTVISGEPDIDEAGTSFVERFNLTLRQWNARYHRKTLAHSKALEQHVNSLSLSMLHYNWVARHSSLKTTPAVAAGLAKHPWPIHWIAGLAELYHESAKDVAARARVQRDSIH